MISLLPIIFISTLCVIGFFFYPAPTQIDLDQSFCSPFNFPNILGCDRMGRDNFALLSYGIVVTVLIAIPARLLTLFLALIFSLLMSYFPKPIQKVFQSFVFVFLSLPSLLIALIVITVMESSFISFLIAIALSDWAHSYEPLQVKIREILESGYVFISKNMGVSQVYIFRKHILPEVNILFWTLFQTGVPAVIMTISIFSYFGMDFGTEIFGPGLGEQISFSKDFVHISALPVILPILGIIALVFSFEILKSKINKIPKNT